METAVCRVNGKIDGETVSDVLAVEEPLEIRIGFTQSEKRTHKAISITMRTPGDDAELAVGFLFTEGIIRSPEQIKQIRHCAPRSESGAVATGFLSGENRRTPVINTGS